MKDLKSLYAVTYKWRGAFGLATDYAETRIMI